MPETLTPFDELTAEETDELFRAIGSGDQESVERLVGQGDFFDPSNESKLFEKMENEIEKMGIYSPFN